jgi:hypothetical protein
MLQPFVQTGQCPRNAAYSTTKLLSSQVGRRGELPTRPGGCTMLNPHRLIGIGFCTEKVSLNKLPGWEQESWGYHGDDGNIFCCQGTRKAYGPKFNTDDIIGCGVNFRNNTAFFTRNGYFLGVACRDINKGKLYPVVGMKKAGEHIRVNFGQQGFFFDIDHYMKVWYVSCLPLAFSFNVVFEYRRKRLAHTKRSINTLSLSFVPLWMRQL